mgnify:CR=1
MTPINKVIFTFIYENDFKLEIDVSANWLNWCPFMILPSLTFFLFFPILLKLNLNFVGAMLIAILSTAICYWGYTIFLNKFFNISL